MTSIRCKIIFAALLSASVMSTLQPAAAATAAVVPRSEAYRNALIRHQNTIRRGIHPGLIGKGLPEESFDDICDLYKALKQHVHRIIDTLEQAEGLLRSEEIADLKRELDAEFEPLTLRVQAEFDRQALKLCLRAHE